GDLFVERNAPERALEEIVHGKTPLKHAALAVAVRPLRHTRPPGCSSSPGTKASCVNDAKARSGGTVCGLHPLLLPHMPGTGKALPAPATIEWPARIRGGCAFASVRPRPSFYPRPLRLAYHSPALPAGPPIMTVAG